MRSVRVLEHNRPPSALSQAVSCHAAHQLRPGRLCSCGARHQQSRGAVTEFVIRADNIALNCPHGGGEDGEVTLARPHRRRNQGRASQSLPAAKPDSGPAAKPDSSPEPRSPRGVRGTEAREGDGEGGGERNRLGSVCSHFLPSQSGLCLSTETTQ